MSILQIPANIRLWLIGLWMLLVVPSATFAYDGQNQANPAYDSNQASADGYDVVPVLTTGKRDAATMGSRVSFGQFSGFLAADAVAAPKIFGLENASQNGLSKFVYNSVTGEFRVAAEDQILHSQILLDGIKENGWRIGDNAVNDICKGGHFMIENGKITDWNWVSGHILGTPEMEQTGNALLKALIGE